MDSYDAVDTGLMAGMMTVMIVSLVIGLLVYLFVAWCTMKIADKTGTPNGWWGFIPIMNVILLLDIAQKPRIWALALIGMIIPLLNIIAGLVIVIGYAYIMMEIADQLGKPKFWGIISVIISPLGFGYLALAD